MKCYKEGKPEIKWPDILEEKLSHVKEMVAYVHVTGKKEKRLIRFSG
jgi:hypothetical protein